MKETVERWHAIYRRTKGNEGLLVALFKRAEDAIGWHEAPDFFFTTTRRVRLRPAPITVEEPSANDCEKALDILDGIINGSDDLIGESIERARELLARLRP